MLLQGAKKQDPKGGSKGGSKQPAKKKEGGGGGKAKKKVCFLSTVLYYLERLWYLYVNCLIGTYKFNMVQIYEKVSCSDDSCLKLQILLSPMF
jgi:hypothetical protein